MSFDDRRGGHGGGRGRGGFDRGPRRDGGQGGGFRRFPREMHKATCSACGKECEVPFKPTEGRPIYCRECFIKSKEGGLPPKAEERTEPQEEKTEETQETPAEEPAAEEPAEEKPEEPAEEPSEEKKEKKDEEAQ